MDLVWNALYFVPKYIIKFRHQIQNKIISIPQLTHWDIGSEIFHWNYTEVKLLLGNLRDGQKSSEQQTEDASYVMTTWQKQFASYIRNSINKTVGYMNFDIILPVHKQLCASLLKKASNKNVFSIKYFSKLLLYKWPFK